MRPSGKRLVRFIKVFLSGAPSRLLCHLPTGEQPKSIGMPRWPAAWYQNHAHFVRSRERATW